MQNGNNSEQVAQVQTPLLKLNLDGQNQNETSVSSSFVPLSPTGYTENPDDESTWTNVDEPPEESYYPDDASFQYYENMSDPEGDFDNNGSPDNSYSEDSYPNSAYAAKPGQAQSQQFVTTAEGRKLSLCLVTASPMQHCHNLENGKPLYFKFSVSSNPFPTHYQRSTLSTDINLNSICSDNSSVK